MQYHNIVVIAMLSWE